MAEVDMLIDIPPTVTFPALGVLYKYQSRIGKTTKQIIRNGAVVIKVESMQQICGLQVWVCREDPANRVAVPKKSIKIRHLKMDQYEAEVDLNGIFYIPDTKKPFYELATSGGDKKNVFKLVAQLDFIDETTSQEFVSEIFQLKTEVTKPKENLKVGILEADSATFKNLVVKEKLTTPEKTADIAYHFRLNDQNNSEKFEEGDVVGFFEQDGADDVYIKRLDADNNDKIVHAGVISRSAYLEANHSQADRAQPTDTVCVLGIVNVKVVGSVRAGERVYASNAFPGKAVPQSHLLLGVGKRKEILLGMALQSSSPKKLDEDLLVQCFVCVVLGVSSLETKEELSELYMSQKLETETEIKLASKRHWKRLCCCFSFSIMLVALLSLTVYQVFAPGSNFRYWLCERGSISGHGFKYYNFSPRRDPLGRYDAHGIEFTYDDLLHKTSPYTFPKRGVEALDPNHAVTHYYLNVDRCAYGYAYGDVGNVIGGYRKIGGGKVFAINWNCTIIFWAAENSVWSPYNKSTLRCWPEMPYTRR